MLSMVTPRLFTVLVTGTGTPATVVSFVCSSDLCLALVTDDDCFGFVWIQTKAVGVQPATNGLETVINDVESLLTAECNVKLVVVGVLCTADISEGCDDASNWRGVDGKQQRTKRAALMHSVVAADR